MKKKNTLLWMSLCLVLILGAGVLLSNTVGDKQQVADTTQSLSVSPGDTMTVNGMTFEQQDGRWVYTQEPDFPLSQEKLTAMTEALAALSADRSLEAPENLAPYGLDAPLATVTTGGQTLTVGGTTSTDGGRYFSLGDGRLYITSQDLVTPFEVTLLDLADTETAPYMEVLDSVTMTRADGTGWTIENRQGELLAYAQSLIWFLGTQALDTEETEALIRNATDLEFLGCAAYAPEDLEALGLEHPFLTVTVRYSAPEEGSYVLDIGNAVSGKYYARIRGSQAVYWMDAVPVNALRDADPAALLPRQVLLLEPEEITAVTVNLAGETWRFTPETRKKQTQEAAENTQGETEIIWLLNGRETSFAQVLTTLRSLTSTGSSRGTEPTLARELEFVFETTDPIYPTVTLCFYRCSAKESLVTLNGESTLFISREDAAGLYETVTGIVLN